MLHARDDYNRIQDPAGLIPGEEPVFLLRAQDEAAVHALQAWIAEARRLGASDDILGKAEAHLARMESWKPKKVPDLP